ncbi:hypothetical protein BC827DRAFT_1223471 [Russula dissimulans]|nr:hypothetical protein BC827DRAFT_1223471 [Russula dissimulans]
MEYLTLYICNFILNHSSTTMNRPAPGASIHRIYARSHQPKPLSGFPLSRSPGGTHYVVLPLQLPRLSRLSACLGVIQISLDRRSLA